MFVLGSPVLSLETKNAPDPGPGGVAIFAQCAALFLRATGINPWRARVVVVLLLDHFALMNMKGIEDDLESLVDYSGDLLSEVVSGA